MSLTPNPDNYTLGRGVVYFDKKDSVTGAYDGERDLGNAPAFTFSIDIATLEHFSSRSGLKSKDKRVVTEVTPKFSFTLDEPNAENYALLTLGEVEDISQVVTPADGGENEALTGVNPDRFYMLAKRNVKITVLKYKTGTVLFNKGAVVTGAGAAHAKILDIDGTVTAGTLYLGVVTAGPFVLDEAITDDGGTPGAAVVDVIDVTTDSVMVTDGEVAPVFYVAGTDYTVDAARGRIKILDGGAIVAADDIEVLYHNATASYKKVKILKDTTLEGRLRFIGDVPVGNNAELEIWRASLTPTGDTALIGEDWSTLGFEGEILKDELGHPESPYMDLLLE